MSNIEKTNIEYQNGAYCWLNKVNGKCYVGGAYGKRGFEGRRKGHLNGLRKGKHPNRHLQGAWNLYGEDSFEFQILERCCADKECIKNVEQTWIDKLKAADSEYGYNLAPLAKSNLGVKYNAESCARIAVNSKAMMADPEARKRTSEKTKAAMEDPALRQYLSDKRKAYLSDLEARKKNIEEIKAAMANPIVRQGISESCKAAYAADPSKAVKISERVKKQWEDPEWRATTIAAMKAGNENPEVRKRKSDSKKGKKQSKEQVENRAAKLRGRKQSTETVARRTITLNKPELRDKMIASRAATLARKREERAKQQEISEDT